MLPYPSRTWQPMLQCPSLKTMRAFFNTRRRDPARRSDPFITYSFGKVPVATPQRTLRIKSVGNFEIILGTDKVGQHSRCHAERGTTAGSHAVSRRNHASISSSEQRDL